MLKAATEIEIHMQLNHPMVNKYIESFENNDCITIVSEYAEQGDLSRLIKERHSKKEYFSEKEIV